MENETKLQEILPETHFLALKEFISQWEDHDQLVGMILCGSFVHGDGDPNSDLDIHVVLKETKNWRKRGNTFINGVEVEYFINPVTQIEAYYHSEYPSSKNTADMFFNSITLIEKDSNELNRLKDLAFEYINKELPEPNDFEIYMFKYSLDDLRKDLLDMVIRQDIFIFDLIYNQIISECQKVFEKVSRIYRNKPKRIFNHYIKIKGGQKFNELLKKCITANTSPNSLEEKYHIVNELITFCDKLIGGPRPQEDSLQSSLNL